MAPYQNRSGPTPKRYVNYWRALSAQEALAWCGHDTLTGREVYRLMRGVTDAGEDQGDDGGEDRGGNSRQDQPASVGPAESIKGGLRGGCRGPDWRR